jgi:hypothetical protein
MQPPRTCRDRVIPFGRCRATRRGSPSARRRSSATAACLLVAVSSLPMSTLPAENRLDLRGEATAMGVSPHGFVPLLASSSGPFTHYPPGGGPAISTPAPARATPAAPRTSPAPLPRRPSGTESAGRRHTPRAGRPASRAAAANAAEAAAWREAWTCGSIFCYHDYLDRYPSGANAEKARGRIRTILGR